MKKFDYKKYLPKAVVVVLCLFFVVGVAWGANNIIEMEGTMVPEADYPAEPDNAVAYINAAISKALDEKPRVEVYESCSIDGDSISADEKLDLAVSLAKADSIRKDIERAIEADYKSTVCETAENAYMNDDGAVIIDYTKELFDVLQLLELSETEIVNSQCQYDYYECPYCHRYFTEAAYKCSECGGNKPLELKREEFVFTITVANGSRSYKNNFKHRDADEIKAILQEKSEGYFDCEKIEAEYSNAVIVARVNRRTDKLTKLEFKNDVEIKTTLNFLGAYSHVGTADTTLKLGDSRVCKFFWPSLELSADEVSIAPKKSEALKATLNCDDPAKYEVSWSSSDESIVSVDSEGYISAKKTDGDATITAEYVFNGITYSDSCLVHVKTIVEGVDISKRKLTLKIGESFTQTAKVSPRKASIKTVSWYSLDENVAIVADDGTITAIAAGNTVVYAVSDDGYYKASCKVEVMS